VAANGRKQIKTSKNTAVAASASYRYAHVFMAFSVQACKKHVTSLAQPTK
jgi:hypothetical protein